MTVMESTKHLVGVQSFKAAMSRLPMAVSVVTLTTEEGPRGVTIGSFTSLSIAPPLVCFNLSKASTLIRNFEEAGYFVVHILSNHQAHLGNLFSVPGLNSQQQFDSIRPETYWKNQPVLSDSAAIIYCSTHQIVEAGDHHIIIGRVWDTRIDNGLEPMLYYDRSYHTLGEHIKD